MALQISGHVDPGYTRVQRAFEANFLRGGEFADVGAGVAVYVRGARVVHLVGGHQDPARTRSWDDRTLVNIWSASKAVLAVAVAQLVETRKLDYGAAVARYWPEFAQSGKSGITVEQVLSHQSGLNGFAEPTDPANLYDWELVTARLARQAPFWTPGAYTSYHGMTFGWLIGEIVQRVTGQRLRDYIRQHIAEPLDADLWLGCPRDRLEDVATIVPPEPDRNPVQLNDVARRTIENPVPVAAHANERAWRDAQIPAVNVHSTADGLARMYAALANRGGFGSTTLLSARGVDALRRMRSPGPDQMLGARRWAAGVTLNADGAFGPDPEAFGHAGWGGTFGCASVDMNVAVGYVVNRMGSRLNGDPRARSICDAVFECVR